MIPKELAKKIRYIEIVTSKAATNILAGEYHSVFKGSGVEFEEVREYLPGDDVRTIDWNVTARNGKPFVKRYTEERELTILFAVDISASNCFGHQPNRKIDAAAEICALLAFSAVKNNDKTGLITFSDQVEKFLPPAKGSRHVLHLVREVLWPHRRSGGTDLAVALDFIGRVVHKRAVIFLISDFQSPAFIDALRPLARMHDVAAVYITDLLEEELPQAGLISLQDAESGRELVLDGGSLGVRAAYAAKAKQRCSELRHLFGSVNVDLLQLSAGDDYVGGLTGFFRRRNFAKRVSSRVFFFGQ